MDTEIQNRGVKIAAENSTVLPGVALTSGCDLHKSPGSTVGVLRCQNWTVYDFTGPSGVPDLFLSEPGAYVVISLGRVLYVGESRDVAQRMKTHAINYARYGTTVMTPWGRYSDLVVKVRYSQRYGDWAMVELRLIRRLRPIFNVRGNKPLNAKTALHPALYG